MSVKKNGKKSNGKQNYRCKTCGRQFINPAELSYEGRRPRVLALIPLMLVRGSGIRDICAILRVSFTTIYSVIRNMRYPSVPKRARYDTLETDEFRAFAGKKSHKFRLIYAWHRVSGEIAAYVRGKRNLKTAKKLGRRPVRSEAGGLNKGGFCVIVCLTEPLFVQRIRKG